jgi:hypothetical protein
MDRSHTTSAPFGISQSVDSTVQALESTILLFLAAELMNRSSVNRTAEW